MMSGSRWRFRQSPLRKFARYVRSVTDAECVALLALTTVITRSCHVRVANKQNKPPLMSNSDVCTSKQSARAL